MKHQPIGSVGATAVLTELNPCQLSRRERLERWAQLLERDPRRKLKALWRVEFARQQDRALMRGDETPIAIAFADPVLREAGLTGDTLGDAQGFFELTEEQAHYLLCDCHYMGRMDGETVARRVRGAIDPPAPQRTIRDLFG